MKQLVFAAALMAAAVAFADKVMLKSGSSLTGTVVGAANGEVTFKSDDLGEVKIPVANIVSLENAGTHVIQYKDNVHESKALAVKDGAYVADQKPLDMASVKAIDPIAEKWHGRVNVAFNATRGNTYDDTAAVIANVHRRWEKDRLAADFGYFYGKKGTLNTDEEKTTDRWEVELKHDHFWLPKVYHYEDLKWERDMIQNLLGRYRLGLGGGYQWLDDSMFESTGKWSFNQEFGANWIKEEFEGPSDASDSGFCGLRYGHHLGFVPKCAQTVEFFHNAEILPDVADWEKFLAKADIGFSTKLVYDLDLLAKIECEYNSQPANDRKKDDVRYIVGLGYKW